jgi:hypothetical protein
MDWKAIGALRRGEYTAYQIVMRLRLRVFAWLLERGGRFVPIYFRLQYRYRRPIEVPAGWPAWLPGASLRAVHLANEITEHFRVSGDLLALARTRDRLDHFELAYWDWLPTMLSQSTEADRSGTFATVLSDWNARTRVGDPDAWNAYTLARRCLVLIWLLRVLPLDPTLERHVDVEVRTARRLLPLLLERDIGGNHLVVELCSLTELCLVLGDFDGVAEYYDRLLIELERQVLGDGGHYELSPGYHAEVNRFVSHVASALESAGVDALGLRTVSDEMSRYTARISVGGRIPELGDTWPTAIPSSPTLGFPRLLTGQTWSADWLSATGLVVVRNDALTLIADTGPFSAVHLPAHAHADGLTFLLWKDDVPVVVDPGVSTYAAGQLRQEERGTRSHNTLSIDGADQASVWGRFRAGFPWHRQATSLCVRRGTIYLSSGLFAQARRGAAAYSHTRVWELSADALTVHDSVRASGSHVVNATVNFGPRTDPEGPRSHQELHVDVTYLEQGAHLSAPSEVMAVEHGRPSLRYTWSIPFENEAVIVTRILP